MSNKIPQTPSGYYTLSAWNRQTNITEPFSLKRQTCLRSG